MSSQADEEGVRASAERVLATIENDQVIGLGSGRAATVFVRALAGRVRAGLRIRAVATSEATARLADSLGIQMTTLATVEELDVAIDGADEVDPSLDLIKGLGGALVREKIVAAAARRFIILVGPEKLVPVLGTHGTLPIEVVPFGLEACQRHLERMGIPALVRQSGSHPFRSDNGNAILDCQIRPLPTPEELEKGLRVTTPAVLENMIRAIPGVVGTGLFLGMADVVHCSDGRILEAHRVPA